MIAAPSASVWPLMRMPPWPSGGQVKPRAALARLASRSRKKDEKRPDLPPEQSLAFGIPFIDIVRRHVREALFSVLAHGFYLPAKRKLGDPSPVCWYGQQDAHWIGYYEVWRRLGLAKYGADLDAELDTWQAIAQTCGWFWPDEDSCVISQRPVAPMTFADGWSVA